MASHSKRMQEDITCILILVRVSSCDINQYGYVEQLCSCTSTSARLGFGGSICTVDPDTAALLLKETKKPTSEFASTK